jgi:uncharacterized protein YodC (DUF2158 family)
VPQILEQIIVLIGKVRDLRYRPSCQFHVGEMVQLRDGTGYPMLVTEIQKTRQMEETLLYCRWFDRQTQETRFNFFPESRVRLFDWSSQ